nr:MAG: replication associated protein [Cressdnaviricota sp.]
MSKKQVKKSRGFCITVQNYDPEDFGILQSYYDEDPLCSYLIIGKEIAPRTGTPHLQCYIYYPNKRSDKAVQKDFAPWHVEPQKSKFNVAAYCYCMEEDDFYEFGERPRQGHRTDLEVIKHDLKKGKSLKKISNEYFSQWCQYRRAFKSYLKLNKVHETIIGCYDKRDCINQMKIVYDNYVNFKVFDDNTSWIEIAKIAASGQYNYIFVPNTPLFVEYYADSIDIYLF